MQVKTVNDGKDQPAHRLLLISSPKKQRSIFYYTREDAEYWHDEILRLQGFLHSRIDQYNAMGKLGQGTFGTVLLAQHKFSEVKVAIKLIEKKTIQKIMNHGQGDQTFEETEILKYCTDTFCANVLELIESFEDATHLYVVTKFMPAGDMLNYLMRQTEQPLSENFAKKLVKQLAEGIEQLHDRNIIHRDIKIENLLMQNFSEDSTVSIGDLGSAKRLASADAKETFIIGTPGYMAPEMI